MRVAFYARVSTDEQAERGNIQSQVDFAKKYFDLYGQTNGITGYESFLDDGVSGIISLVERPAAAKMLADAKTGKFQIVYVYRLDRLARSVKHVLDTYEFLEEINVSLRSMTEPFDTSTPTGKFFMTLLASIAALERDTILERTMLGKERAAKEGRWSGGQYPYGYRIGDDGKLETYEPEAEVVRLIFKLYLEGMRMVPLAEYLNARDIPTPTKSKKLMHASTGKWNAGHISIILRNRAYIGEYKTLLSSKFQKDGVTLIIPRIISEDDFLKTQKIIDINADKARSGRKRMFLLRSIIYCGHCGYAMIGNNSSGRVYYRCSKRTRHGNGPPICDSKQIKAEKLEQVIWSEIVNFIKNPGDVIRMIQEKIQKTYINILPAEKEMKEIESAILEKKAARGRILSLVSKGYVGEDEAGSVLMSTSRELEVLKRRREELFGLMLQSQEEKNNATDIAVALNKYENVINNLEPIPEIVKLLVERIDVYTEIRDGKPCHRADIRYRFTPDTRGLELSESTHTITQNILLTL